MQLKSLFMLLFNSLLSTKYTVTIAPYRDSLKSSLILQTTWNILNLFCSQEQNISMLQIFKTNFFQDLVKLPDIFSYW